MPKQKFEVELDVPDGYEIDGYRSPKVNELFLNLDGDWMFSDIDSKRKFFVLRKIQAYRDPVLPADWGKPARFSDDGKEWVEDNIAGYAAWSEDDNWRWGSVSRHEYFKFCQIAD
ncbi:MAG: hypothetical protein ACK57V_04675 [Pirellula sp.]|jgi:hypothetical protein